MNSGNGKDQDTKEDVPLAHSSRGRHMVLFHRTNSKSLLWGGAKLRTLIRISVLFSSVIWKLLCIFITQKRIFFSVVGSIILIKLRLLELLLHTAKITLKRACNSDCLCCLGNNAVIYIWIPKQPKDFELYSVKSERIICSVLFSHIYNGEK